MSEEIKGSIEVPFMDKYYYFSSDLEPEEMLENLEELVKRAKSKAEKHQNPDEKWLEELELIMSRKERNSEFSYCGRYDPIDYEYLIRDNGNILYRKEGEWWIENDQNG